MENKLSVALFWHMHQPLYKDPFTEEYQLPWVLFHATKDYYDMASILDEFPGIKQTFNMVPSLIEQLKDYEDPDVKDLTRRVTEKPADELTLFEKKLILERFFQANWNEMIKPYPRYWELLKKRGFAGSDAEIESAARYFTEQDFLDLQILFNLSWIDPATLGSDSELVGLREKGGGYEEGDKRLLLSRQTLIVKSIIPKYRELIEAGSMEVTTSPYYHPILPLLCNSESAREAHPEMPLPKEIFAHPEDAAAQLRMAVELHRETFGVDPAGLWPSEGSVSMELMPLIKEAGFKWLATDEEILAHSIGRHLNRDEYGNLKDNFVYRPYSVTAGDGELKMVFRDHKLSDLIGFDYAKWDAERAADDLITRLLSIDEMVEDPSNSLVSIILDGENAWETYPNDGRDFLSALYLRLTDHPRLKTSTVGGFLSTATECERIERVFAGSWINHDFGIWIGHPEDNTAWDHIKETRVALKSAEGNGLDEAVLKEAWNMLYAAQGSDWFWWYGDTHSSANDEIFDSLFRLYLKKVYEIIGAESPLSLEVPIITRERGIRPLTKPTAFIEPLIDGEISTYFEWLEAGIIEATLGGGRSGAMHMEGRVEPLLDKISYGFDIERLYLRFDHPELLQPFEGKLSITINILHPRALRVLIDIDGAEAKAKAVLFERLADSEGEGGGWKEIGAIGEIKSLDVIEFSLPFSAISAGPTDELWLYFIVDGNERGIERWPVKGFVIIDVPDKDFGVEEWSV